MATPAATPDTAHISHIESDNLFKRIFLSPAVTILLLLSIFPLIWSLGISFTDLQRGGSTSSRNQQADSSAEASGFLGQNFEITGRNYERILDDRRLHTAAQNTLFYVVAGVLLQYTIGFGLALVLNQDFFGRNLVRVIFLMPMMMTPVAVAYSGRMLLDANPTRSPLADLVQYVSINYLGMERMYATPWFTDADWAPYAVVLIDSWQWIPFVTLILLAGLQAIPDDIYEAARVDGASAFTLFRKITFPLLLPVSLTVILIRGLEIFKIIDVIVITTGGGPGSATESLTMYIFDTALTFGNFGYAAAISFALLLLVILFSTVFLWLGRRFSPLSNGQ